MDKIEDKKYLEVLRPQRELGSSDPSTQTPFVKTLGDESLLVDFYQFNSTQRALPPPTNRVQPRFFNPLPGIAEPGGDPKDDDKKDQASSQVSSSTGLPRMSDKEYSHWKHQYESALEQLQNLELVARSQAIADLKEILRSPSFNMAARMATRRNELLPSMSPEVWKELVSDPAFRQDIIAITKTHVDLPKEQAKEISEADWLHLAALHAPSTVHFYQLMNSLGRHAENPYFDVLIDFAEMGLELWPQEKGLRRISFIYNPALTNRQVDYLIRLARTMKDPFRMDIGDTEPVAQGFRRLTQVDHAGTIIHVDLSGGSLSGRWIELLASAPLLKGVRDLDLSRNSVTGMDVIFLISSPKLTELEELNLSENPIFTHDNDGSEIKASWRSLGATNQLQNLSKLDLSNTGLRANNLATLLEDVTGEPFSRLTHLNLSKNPFLEDESGIRILVQSSVLMGNVTHLTLRGAVEGYEINDVGMSALVESPYTKNIVSLDLGENIIGDAGMEAFAKGSWDSLKFLNLEGNPIGPLGIQALAEAEQLPGFEVLNLSKINLGGETMGLLANAPHLEGVKQLILHNCSLDAEAMEALLQSPLMDGLESLDISYNFFSLKEVLELIAQSPHSSNLSSQEWYSH